MHDEHAHRTTILTFGMMRVLSSVLIADDEPLARERIRELVRAIAPDVEISEAGNGADAVAAIHTSRPDAVFLDVQMPGLDGFAVVESIGAAHMPPVVFVTAFDAHAMRAFDVAAVDYLLKPFDDARFLAAWQRLERAHAADTLSRDADRLIALLETVRANVSSSTPASVSTSLSPSVSPSISPAVTSPLPAGQYLERVLVRSGDRTVIVPIRDVHWMQSDGNYLDLHTGTGVHTLRETLVNLEAQLDPMRFVRVHRRVIVAIDQIREMQPWFAGDQIMILRDGTRLRVARTRREAVMARLERGT